MFLALLSIVAVLILCSVVAGKVAAGRRRAEQERKDAARAAFREPQQAWLSTCIASMDRSRWIRKGSVECLLATMPHPEVAGFTWNDLTGDDSPAHSLLSAIAGHNAAYLQRQKGALKDFFDTVEKNPLTDEQIQACVCMDDNVLVVAAAGSGKTSTMVAKTGYVLRTGLAAPEQILLLAFNRDAADELGSRVAEQLKGVPDIGKVRSQTFHGFGLEVIGVATGRKPSVAPWVESGRDLKEMVDIIETLCRRDAAFLLGWNLFRTVYARDMGPLGEDAEPEVFRDGSRGFLTANDLLVKSGEERWIANWLFYNGVTFQYERAYEHDTTTGRHQQYRPDFYYPDIQLYHEHFALNADGQPPKHFRDYLAGVDWKRALHKEKGTELFETQSHEMRSGMALKRLEAELTRRGVRLRFDPDRQGAGPPPPDNEELARTFRVFQQHVKNNGLSAESLRANLSAQSRKGFGPRLALFLDVYERIAAEWEARLRAGGYIDFEDMLVQAARLVESGQYESPFTVILADEFQDSSRARIRLLKALTSRRDGPAHLCVVGDDWQGINRFAGSDIAVMTEFEKGFAHSTRLTLNTTFRCPQLLCDVSSRFIQMNPVQIRKSVRTTNSLTNSPLLAYSLEDGGAIQDLVGSQLSELADLVRTGRVQPMKGGRVSVMLLGRYRNDRPSLMDRWSSQLGDVLDLEFRTAHSSKGLEAEYVLVLNVTEGTRGFPSQMQDDPALQMAMPAPDDFPFAEERRLFYVAMTRARKQVRFYTVNGKPSRFLVELVKNNELTIEVAGGELPMPCPKCQMGVLVRRNGRYGEFQACSRLAQCDYKANLEAAASSRPIVKAKASGKVGDRCPQCRQGRMERKQGKYGSFVGCSRWPKCNAKGS